MSSFFFDCFCVLQVFNMFHHHSLGIRINIRVTKLVLLHTRPVSHVLYMYVQNYVYKMIRFYYFIIFIFNQLLQLTTTANLSF